MPLNLFEYMRALDERGVLWPAAPLPVPAKARPYLEPLEGLRAVTWSIYGTLLSISDGRLLHLVDDALRMEVALDKTVQEFNMWNSMYRKPGAPWELMYQQYRRLVETVRMSGKGRKGELPEVDSAAVWRVLLERLLEKNYRWDREQLGELPELCQKVAYYFHAALQGVAAAPGALRAILHVGKAGCRQALIGDGQCFSTVQLVRALSRQGPVAELQKVFSRSSVSLSHRLGVRQPNARLFEAPLAQLGKLGIKPHQVLHVASRLAEELAPARRLGMKTALFAGDKQSLQASAALIMDPEYRPDRILTDLAQIRQIVTGTA
jgi:FMN phosphatase YigB (HAD superfamily)